MGGLNKDRSREAAVSFCLVWRPSLGELPGPSYLLFSLSPKRWLLLALKMFKLVYNSVWALVKYCLHQMSSSAYSRTVFLCNVFRVEGEGEQMRTKTELTDQEERERERERRTACTLHLTRGRNNYRSMNIISNIMIKPRDVVH